ncbi:MAG TPA: type II secretion system protein GspK, partial [Oligoflexia bacterium]|nr:type II secretion system protein GspK [Oligoflexia bacterium]
MKRRLGGKQNESGIALFMVISTVALLGVLVTELTYSTQVSSRLAYNALDNAKAYYLAKAAYRFSLVRLSAYAAVKKFLDDPQNKTIKATVNPFVDRIWDIPFAFPPPLPKDAPASVADPVKEFVAESSLAGNYTAMIFGQSSKINFNNLFIKEVDAETESENSNTGNSGASNNAKSSNKTTNSNGEEKEEVNFRPMVETTISTLLNQKMSQDQEFAEVYRNVTGADVIDAIEGYLKRESRGSALPGYRAPETPKEAPFYDISELHMVPGINDEIYNLLIDTFTASATPGINVNMASR